MLRYDTELPTQRNSNIEGIQFHKEIVLKESVWEYLRLGRLSTVYISQTQDIGELPQAYNYSI